MGASPGGWRINARRGLPRAPVSRHSTLLESGGRGSTSAVPPACGRGVAAFFKHAGGRLAAGGSSSRLVVGPVTAPRFKDAHVTAEEDDSTYYDQVSLIIGRGRSRRHFPHCKVILFWSLSLRLAQVRAVVVEQAFTQLCDQRAFAVDVESMRHTLGDEVVGAVWALSFDLEDLLRATWSSRYQGKYRPPSKPR